MSRIEQELGAAVADEPWYRRAFETAYLDLYAHRNDEDAARAISFVHSQVHLLPGLKVLDLCCGSGRHLAQVQKLIGSGDGYGLDLSRLLLREANALLRPGRPKLCEGDMRFLPFTDGRFDLVLNLFTSFGYFEEEPDHLQVLREIHRVLRNGGALILDHINKPHLEENLQPESRKQIRRGLEVIERRAINQGGRRVEKHVIWREEGHPPVEWVESVRIYESGEIMELFCKAGLNVEKLFGDYDGSPLAAHSPRMIVLTRKK